MAGTRRDASPSLRTEAAPVGLPAQRTGGDDVGAREVFESTGVGIAVTDLRGRVIDANAALGRLLGCRPRDLVGRLLNELQAGAMPAIDIDDLLTGRRSAVRYESRYRRADGSELGVAVTASPVHDELGRIRAASFVPAH